MMKKLLCLCAALTLLLVAVPVSAAGTGTFVVSDAAGKPGDTVNVTISTATTPVSSVCSWRYSTIKTCWS